MHDIVLVGAGTAGCVLAERLTASGRLRVLLIEAGGKPTGPYVAMPAGFPRLFKSRHDWAFESEPQTAADGRRVFTPRGKMLGGSSNMNAQIHQWCHPADFDGWVAAGATGWGWDDVAPVFLAQERWLGEDGDRPRGRTGPMIVSPNRYAHPLTQAFLTAARSIGLTGPRDYNGGPYSGAWLCQLAHKDGRRFSAYDAYLVPALRRPNLTVLTDCQTTRVGFEQGRAVSVRACEKKVGQASGLSGNGRVCPASPESPIASPAFGVNLRPHHGTLTPSSDTLSRMGTHQCPENGSTVATSSRPQPSASPPSV